MRSLVTNVISVLLILLISSGITFAGSVTCGVKQTMVVGIYSGLNDYVLVPTDICFGGSTGMKFSCNADGSYITSSLYGNGCNTAITQGPTDFYAPLVTSTSQWFDCQCLDGNPALATQYIKRTIYNDAACTSPTGETFSYLGGKVFSDSTFCIVFTIEGSNFRMDNYSGSDCSSMPANATVSTTASFVGGVCYPTSDNTEFYTFTIMDLPTDTTTESTSDNTPPLPMLAMIGIAAGCAVLAMLVIYFYMRSHAVKPQTSDGDSDNAIAMSYGKGVPPATASSHGSTAVSTSDTGDVML